MPAAKKIHIRYFALLREESKKNEEAVTTQSETAGQLYDELAKKYGFTLSQKSLRVVINDVFKPWETKIADTDRVVFIPPVAGG